ncbi:MAG: hypothetical protein LBP59_01355 [Planctomycetaceae bacterium]|jgi:hypothetical protein|nr:hypothetical protein [Planctomycetaceae bacterium]
MVNNYVKKSSIFYFGAIVFLLIYCEDGLFCRNLNAQSIQPIQPNTITTTTPKKDKTTPIPNTILTTTQTSPPKNAETTTPTTAPHTTTTTPTTPSITPAKNTTPQNKTTESNKTNNTTQNNSTQTTISQTPEITNQKQIVIPPVQTLTAMEHSWGRFAPSSWRRVQTTVWTISEGRKIGNVSETKTVLDSVDKNSVTLLEFVTAGTNAETTGIKPVKKQFDFYNVKPDEGAKISNDMPMKLIIDGRIVPCERRIYEQTSAAVTRKITVWYSTQIYPYVMRIERTVKSAPTTAEPNVKILSQSTFEVTDSAAFRLLTSKQGTYRTRTIKRSGDVTTVTDSYCSMYVPGGLIKENTHEFDGVGNEIRTSETRLLNYYYLPTPPTIIIPNTIIQNQPLIIQYEPVRPRWIRSYRLRPTPYLYYTD